MYPALAVAGALGKTADVLWVGGAQGMEEELVMRAGIPFEGIPAAGLHGVGLGSLPGNILQLARGTLAARRLIAAFDPDVLFFTGGYVSGPVAVAGLGRPKVTFVPDIEPALAQRLISRLADRICVTTEDSQAYYPDPSKVRVTGYPTRFEGRETDPAAARRQFDLKDGVAILLVLGGSRGARSINRAVWNALDQLLERCQIIHITGERDWPELEERTGSMAEVHRAGYRPYPYLHEEMGPALAAADLVVSRAGASTLGEYPLFRLPAILVPYPHAWGYQRTNARFLAERGAALVVEDERVEGDLVPMILDLLARPADMGRMAAAAAGLARPMAVQNVAAELVSQAKKGGVQ